MDSKALHKLTEMILTDVLDFWGLEDEAITLDQLKREGKYPQSTHELLRFRMILEALAAAKVQAKQRAEEDEWEQGLSEEERQKELEDAAWAQREARIRDTNDPDELWKIHQEDQALLNAEHKAEREEIQRRAERAYFLRQKAEGKLDPYQIYEDELRRQQEEGE